MVKLKVKEEEMLLNFLIKNTDYSRNKIKSLLKYKSIYINGKNRVSYDAVLKKGDVVEISLEKRDVRIGKIDIIYEDKNYLVVHKPSGMLTISTEKEKNRTLYHAVRGYVKSKDKHNKIFIVHRLDRETSGLVIFSKNEDLKRTLQENWDKVAVRREYTAVVSGILDKKKDRLVDYLKENSSQMVHVSFDRSGKEAIMNYEVLKEKRNSLVSILLETGRKNQIRVQFSHRNHPIVGDKKYGNIKSKQLLLCANRLDIKDPLTSKTMSFEIKIPKEFIRSI